MYPWLQLHSLFTWMPQQLLLVQFTWTLFLPCHFLSRILHHSPYQTHQLSAVLSLLQLPNLHLQNAFFQPIHGRHIFTSTFTSHDYPFLILQCQIFHIPLPTQLSTKPEHPPPLITIYNPAFTFWITPYGKTTIFSYNPSTCKLLLHFHKITFHHPSTSANSLLEPTSILDSSNLPLVPTLL